MAEDLLLEGADGFLFIEAIVLTWEAVETAFVFVFVADALSLDGMEVTVGHS